MFDSLFAQSIRSENGKLRKCFLNFTSLDLKIVSQRMKSDQVWVWSIVGDVCLLRNNEGIKSKMVVGGKGVIMFKIIDWNFIDEDLKY